MKWGQLAIGSPWHLRFCWIFSMNLVTKIFMIERIIGTCNIQVGTRGLAKHRLMTESLNWPLFKFQLFSESVEIRGYTFYNTPSCVTPQRIGSTVQKAVSGSGNTLIFDKFLNDFHWIHWILWQKLYKKRSLYVESATACVRDRDYTTVPPRHR